MLSFQSVWRLAAAFWDDDIIYLTRRMMEPVEGNRPWSMVDGESSSSRLGESFIIFCTLPRCHTLPETNIAAENGWLEDEFPFGKASCKVLC